MSNLSWPMATLTSLSWCALSLTAWAQTLNPAPIIFNDPPTDTGMDKNGDGSGGRPSCPDLPLGLTPLTPTLPETETLGGYTSQTHPTFWFYSPYSPEWVEEVKLSVRKWNDTQKREIALHYETEINYTSSGVIQVRVPEDAPPLEAETWYNVYLFVDVYCTETSPISTDNTKFALFYKPISTIPPNTSLRQEAVMFARYGYWFDALKQVAQSNNITDWSKLLTDGELTEFVEFSLTDCCEVIEDKYNE